MTMVEAPSTTGPAMEMHRPQTPSLFKVTSPLGVFSTA